MTQQSTAGLGACQVERLEPASAAQLAACSLLHRQETKFVLSADRLAELVERIASQYRVAHSGQEAIARYRTLYFDTPSMRCYQDQRGVLPRHKVRIRHYDDRQLSVVEVKTRTRDCQTQKSRLSKDYGDSILSDRDLSFVSPRVSFSARDLVPQLWTNFARATLVGGADERITLDSDLEFQRGQRRLKFAGVAVVEVKQAQYSEQTPIMRALAKMGLCPRAVSKYGAAVALTNAHGSRARFASGTSAP
jgi:hypothetical protein